MGSGPDRENDDTCSLLSWESDSSWHPNPNVLPRDLYEALVYAEECNVKHPAKQLIHYGVELSQPTCVVLAAVYTVKIHTLHPLIRCDLSSKLKLPENPAA